MMPIERLPIKAQPVAYRLRALLMGDATLLVVVGIMAIARGMSYIVDLPPMHFVELWIPADAWGIIWVIAGALALVGAAVYRSTFAAVTVGLAVGLYVLWGCSFFLQSLLWGPPLWSSAITNWGIATITVWAVWRGSRMHLREGSAGE